MSAGTILSAPIETATDEVFSVNADGSAGTITVEVTDTADSVITGYGGTITASHIGKRFELPPYRNVKIKLTLAVGAKLYSYSVPAVALAPQTPTLALSHGDTWATLGVSFTPHADYPDDQHVATVWRIALATDPSFTDAVVYVRSTDDKEAYFTEDLTESTDYIAQAATEGLDGLLSDWSEVVELTTDAGTTKGDTPSLSLVEKGDDYIEVEISAYNHPDGEVEPSAFDPDDPKPWHQLSEIQARLSSDPDWSTPLETITVTYTEDVESRRVRFEELTAGTSYKFRGRQLDGYLAVYTEYSSDLTQSTDAAPANAPLQPTVDITCGRSIVMTGSAYEHATSGAGTNHAKTQARICYGGKCQTHTVNSPVEAFEFPDNPPGSASVYLRYGDDSTPTRWGPWSDADVCVVPDYPPSPQFTAPAALVVATSTVIQWTYSDPNEVGWTSDIERASGTGDFVTIATGQVAQSTTFTITGLPNGDYTYRVRARNPTTDEVGEWGVLPIILDRTETRFFHKTASDLATATGRQIWDDETHVAWTGLPGEGLFASRVHTGSTVRRSGYVFDEWGEPDEFDLIVRMEHIPKECDWYWRFANANQTKGGAMASGVDGDPGTRSGRQTLYDVGIQPWYLGGPNALCFSANIRNQGLALTAKRAITHPGNVWRYGQSYNRGSLRTVTARNGTGSYSHSSVTLPSGSSPAVSGPAVNIADGEGGEVRQPVTLFLRVRRSVQGGHTGRTFQARFMGAGIGHSDWHQTAFVRDTDDQGRTIPCGACGLAFQDMDTSGVGRSEGILFTSVTLRVVEYGSCEASEDLLVGCEADWRFTTFRPDDVTPQYGTYSGTYRDGAVAEADYYDNRACPRPYLMAVKDFSETSIDYVSGSSDIGQIRVGVLDKRLTSDQDTGIVTAIIDDAIGRRGVLERWREDLGYVTVFDGVIESVQFDESAAVWWFNVRDPREREREIPMFERNETFSVYPEVGPVDAYGIFPNPDDGYLVAPVAYDDTQEFQLQTPGGGDQGVHYGYVRLTQVSDEHLDTWAYPIGFGSLDADANRRTFPNVTIRWRPLAGSTWTYLRNMPAPLNPAFGSVLAGTRIIDNVVMGRNVVVAPALYFGSEDPDDLPDHEEAIEFQILAAKTTEKTPYFWDKGTFGDLYLACVEGDFTDNPPEFRYNETRFAEWAEETERARFIAYEPVKNLREWVEKNIFGARASAPSFDEYMRTVPSEWELPDASQDLVELNADWIVPVGDFSDEAENVINSVKYTYIREWVYPPETSILRDAVLGTSTLSPWERYDSARITRIFTNETSAALFGPEEIEYEPVTVRGLGGWGGVEEDFFASLNGAQSPEQIVGRVATGVLNRFAWGAPEYLAEVRAGMAHGPGFDPMTLDLRVGDWVKARVPWLPNYVTGRRSLFRYMQIMSITDPDIAVRRLRLVDGGPVVEESLEGLSDDPDVLPFLEPPDIDYLSETADGRVEVPVFFPAGMPADYRARVDYAVSLTEPAETSGEWRLVGYLSAEGSIYTPPIPAGETVWVRARGEATGRRPSAWGPAQSIMLSDTPALLSLGLVLVEDGDGLVQLRWTPNAFAGGVEVEVSTGALGHTPAFGAFDEVDAGSSPLNLTGEEIGYDEELYARVTAWETFSLGAVGGTEGREYIVSIARRAPSATATHEWGAHSDTDFLPPEERADGMTGLWSTYTRKFELGVVASFPSFVGNALKLLRVNAAETAVEWWTLLVNLASQVTGVLGISNGGTGLSTLGTASQQLRVNAGATALEYFTPSGGSTQVIDIAYARAANTFNFAVNTNWQDVDTSLDLTLSGLEDGDFVLVWINGSWSSGSQTGFLDVVSRVSGSPVNSWGNDGAPSAGGAGVGNRGWLCIGNVVDTASGPIGRIIGSDDLDSGTLTLRLIGRLNAASGAKAFTTHDMGAVAIRL